MAPGDFQRGAQFVLAQRGQNRRRRALAAPAAGNRLERLGREQAFEFLLLRGEHEIGGEPVRRERRKDARDLERRAVEMRRLARAFERKRDAPEIVAVGQGRSSSALWPSELALR